MARSGGSKHSTRKLPPEQRAKQRPAGVPASVPAPASSDAPEPPAELGEHGREAWLLLWNLGVPSGAYSDKADAFVLLRYGSLVDRREDLLAIVAAEGLTTEGSQGQVIQHPAARMLSQVEADMLKLEDRLGLNPVARFSLQGLALGVEEQQSKLAEFLKG